MKEDKNWYNEDIFAESLVLFGELSYANHENIVFTTEDPLFAKQLSVIKDKEIFIRNKGTVEAQMLKYSYWESKWDICQEKLKNMFWITYGIRMAVDFLSIPPPAKKKNWPKTKMETTMKKKHLT
jgi:hypothetical protein